MGTDQLKELKKLQSENEQFRRAVADLTLDKQILREAAQHFLGLAARASFEATKPRPLEYHPVD